jgi:Undecaprenyl-phosphate glucose phosphotransferase
MNDLKRLQPYLLRLADTLILLGLSIAIFVVYSATKDIGLLVPYVVVTLVAAALAGSIWRRLGVYEEIALFRLQRTAAQVIFGWALTFAVLLSIGFALKISANFSRVWATSLFFLVPPFLIVFRVWLARWISAQRRQGRFTSRAVIVGEGSQAQRLAMHFIRSKDHSIDITGFVAAKPDSDGIAEMEKSGLTCLGDLQDLVSLIRKGTVDEALIAFPWAQEREIERVIETLAATPVVIRLAPDMIGYHFTDRGFSQVAQLPMLQLFDRPISGWDQAIKLIEDKLIAATGLIVLSPLLLLIAAAIKLNSPGPIFFRQPRYGFNHNLIEVWKFRSMYAERSDQGGGTQAKKNDPRVTKVGAFIRRTSLDELPQLFNVFFGTMSIVGPRPHPVETRAGGRLFEEVVDNYAARHRVKPGITGWAQINGWRGETNTEEKIRQRVEHDLYYIDNWSIWLDLWIIFRTVLIIFRDKNAY